MLASVFAKTLRDQRRSLAGWVVAILLIILMYAAIWPSIRDQPSINDFLDTMPEAFRNLFTTTGADMSTPEGYIQIELMSFMAPLIVLLYAVGQGAGAVAGEEDRHTLDLLLSSPVSRARVVLEKTVAMVVGVVLIAGLTGIALVLEGRAFDMRLPVDGVVAAMTHLALLGLVFGALALAVGGATGHPGWSKAVPAVVGVVTYIVNGLAPLVGWLEPFQRLSPFYQYAAHDPLRTGISWPGIAVAAATAATLVLLAVVGFRRRDVEG